MGERFVVVPVDGGVGVPAEGEHSDAVVVEPSPGGGGGGGDAADGKEAGGEPAPEPHEPGSVVPILEYSREPNKYGKSGHRAPRPASGLPLGER